LAPNSILPDINVGFVQEKLVAFILGLRQYSFEDLIRQDNFAHTAGGCNAGFFALAHSFEDEFSLAIDAYAVAAHIDANNLITIRIKFFTANRTVKILASFLILLCHCLICKLEFKDGFSSTTIKELLHSNSLIPPIFDEQTSCKYFRERCFLHHFADPFLLILKNFKSLDKLIG
jgi:hypothetical protein